MFAEAFTMALLSLRLECPWSPRYLDREVCYSTTNEVKVIPILVCPPGSPMPILSAATAGAHVRASPAQVETVGVKVAWGSSLVVECAG
jgi:hypothetical protein